MPTSNMIRYLKVHTNTLVRWHNKYIYYNATDRWLSSEFIIHDIDRLLSVNVWKFKWLAASSRVIARNSCILLIIYFREQNLMLKWNRQGNRLLCPYNKQIIYNFVVDCSVSAAGNKKLFTFFLDNFAESLKAKARKCMIIIFMLKRIIEAPEKS